jgi:hypothetical protein
MLCEPPPNGNFRASRNLLPRIALLLLLLLLFSLAGHGTAGAANILDARVSSLRPAPQFAIADFDGDHRPDLAIIQAEASGTGSTEYWIELQLSTSGEQSIEVVAPTGGLRIEAIDVNNGNHFVDLVVTTAWLRQPVAIFINDGHGRFSRVQTTAFPEVFADSTTNWGSPSDQPTDTVGVSPHGRSSIFLEAIWLPFTRPQACLISHASAGFHLRSFLISHAGRAPPSEDSHS